MDAIRDLEVDETSLSPTVAELFGRARHGGNLAGARRRGLARGEERLVVEIALFDGDGATNARARWKSTTCVALMACAERACQLIEGGMAPEALDAPALRGGIRGLHRRHHTRADLVIQALRAALCTHQKSNQGVLP